MGKKGTCKSKEITEWNAANDQLSGQGKRKATARWSGNIDIKSIEGKKEGCEWQHKIHTKGTTTTGHPIVI